MKPGLSAGLLIDRWSARFRTILLRQMQIGERRPDLLEGRHDLAR
jgi:hypothetical protein